MAFAETTTVAFEKSIAEIVGLLRKAGADTIAQVEGRSDFQLQFTMADRQIRFRVTFPDDAAVTRMTGPRQDPVRVGEQWRRQRGRALLLVLKAKLESIESGVETFEQAFLANVVLSDGSTVYEQAGPAIAEEYRLRAPQQLLIGAPR